MSLKDFITERLRGTPQVLRLKGIPVEAKGTKADVAQVIRDLEDRVPDHFLTHLQIISIDRFPDLEKDQLLSDYNNNEIRILSTLRAEEMFSAMLHEIAHHVETLYNQDIYGDGSIISEFLGKRDNLYRRIAGKFAAVDQKMFRTIEFDDRLQDLFYETIGLDAMTNFVLGLFPSPYAAVSVKEYWAIGFENFITDQYSNDFTKRISPNLYKKLNEVYFIDET